MDINDIRKRRVLINRQISKGFNDNFSQENISKAYDDEFNKAHKVGDIHPNGKWVWTEYKPGKFDWRGVKKTKGSTVGSKVSSAATMSVNGGQSNVATKVKAIREAIVKLNIPRVGKAIETTIDGVKVVIRHNKGTFTWPPSISVTVGSEKPKSFSYGSNSALAKYKNEAEATDNMFAELNKLLLKKYEVKPQAAKTAPVKVTAKPTSKVRGITKNADGSLTMKSPDIDSTADVSKLLDEANCSKNAKGEYKVKVKSLGVNRGTMTLSPKEMLSYARQYSTSGNTVTFTPVKDDKTASKSTTQAEPKTYTVKDTWGIKTYTLKDAWGIIKNAHWGGIVGATPIAILPDDKNDASSVKVILQTSAGKYRCYENIEIANGKIDKQNAYPSPNYKTIREAMNYAETGRGNARYRYKSRQIPDSAWYAPKGGTFDKEYLSKQK